MNLIAARYHVVHETTYSYESPVSLSRQHLHLTPRDCPWQSCLAHQISIDPEPTHSRSRPDCFGNPVRQFDIEAPHSRLTVCAESTIEVRPHLPMGLDGQAETGFQSDWLAASPSWEEVSSMLAYGAAPVRLEANRFLFESPYVRVKREFSAYARPSFTPLRPLLCAVQDLMRRIHDEFEFDPAATTVATPVLKILEDKHGVCQDFAHLMLACLRSLGLAARYVSGYLLTHPPPGQPRLVGADASHAWISVYCPSAEGGGWVDFDPTNNLLPDTQHITLAWGRDFGDVSPLRGVILGGDAHELDVAVTVTPLENGVWQSSG
ncbi:transglutaminase family protein [Propionivibrio sp.]|uniref:transglutaminase family protein n=1 Tax=Propionivibrio sp. TaxID=2212460 RepID=UPI002628C0A3|nr:transglutaminase family protein [Propionivibrio sp.]